MLAITEDYLGPAAQRFISRLVTNHLGKPADKINRDDIPQLVVWIRLAATVITDDELVVTDFIQRLEKLSSSQLSTKARGDASNHHATAA